MDKIKIIESTDSKYPKRLLNIKQKPNRLYVIGDERLLNKKSIAIVGARDCTEYGMKNAKIFAERISKNNICIVSGLAIGIDTAAHIGALKYKGNTIAVLACGFDNIYPKENEELFKKIIENGGCVISEYEPNTKVILSRFPKRNRIISGLSIGVLVVEARYRSGSLITARYGKEQKKKIFCIPSNINLKTSVGTNKLIQTGAKLVISPDDILDEFSIKVNKMPERNDIEIEKDYLEIYSVLSYIPTNINVICKKSKLSISEVTQKILIMELKGYVKSLPGGEYVKL